MKTNPKAKSSSSSPDSRQRRAGNTSTSTGTSSVGAVFKIGTISLTFLILGYQVCLFVQHTAKLKIEANRDRPDTVVIYRMPDQVGHDGQAGQDGQAGHDTTSLPAPTGNLVREAGYAEQRAGYAERRAAPHTPAVQAVRAKGRKRESFRFDPNTVSVEDLQRLGFSEKQAQSIDNYRRKGGKYRRKEDFAKSFVVADSVYRRLEPYIDIPRLDINKADSAAFDALPGIGPYFAAKMVSYREELGGYSSPKQLLEIYNFGEERYEKLKDLIVCSDPPRPLRLWTLPEDSLKLHPHIRYKSVAHGIILYRDNNPPSEWTLEGLLDAGVIDSLTYSRLRLCVIPDVSASGDAPEPPPAR